tara:strand:+ start:609 stop:1781 length:1173 start_codon:yes stop_codon:yes gene_type:complete
MLETLRKHSLKKLEKFISNGINSYSSKRNYDFGPSNRSNISLLSPYIRKRILHEKEVINRCLEHFSLNKIEKFIQEVFWRVYWKGWLEGRVKVWENYKKDLESLISEYSFGRKKDNYNMALQGKTGIDCFDDWVKELINYGYLHNHSRMWFASIWIHTLQLPWELGANFFLKNLIDGDPASNTLSWRWVAGLHTKGKCYMANEDNIKKFSNGRYTQEKILNKQIILPEFQSFMFEKKGYKNLKFSKKNNLILLNINNLSYLDETLEMMEQNFVCFINHNINYEYSVLPKKFNKRSIDEYLIFLKDKNIECRIFSTYENFFKFFEKSEFSKIFTFYPSIGYELDYLNLQFKKYNVKLNFIYDNFDKLCWEYASSGFFKFKSKIPLFISKIN